MFEQLRKLAQNVIDLDVDSIIRQVLSDAKFQKEIIKLNTEEQLFKRGVNSLGIKLSDIGGDYADFTIQKAIEDGRPKKSPSDINLHNEGIFYKTFKVKFQKDHIDMSANPSRGNSNLFDDWGEEIVGLDSQSRDVVVKFLIKEIPNVLRKKILA